MDDIFPDPRKEQEDHDEADKLDQAFHDMEMIYRSRCVDVPLNSNVTVVDIDKPQDAGGSED